MKPSPSIRPWSRVLLVALVLLVMASALCTVAGSAAAQERGLIAPAAAP